MENFEIEIVNCVETIDNFGKEMIYTTDETADLLRTPDEWTDDQKFYVKDGHSYFIDDLIGKNVKVGSSIFLIKE